METAFLKKLFPYGNFNFRFFLTFSPVFEKKFQKEIRISIKKLTEIIYSNCNTKIQPN